MRRVDRSIRVWRVGVWLGLAVAGAVPLGAMEPVPEGAALEVRIVPADFLVANTARHVGLGYQGASPYYDLVLQAIYFINHGAGPLTIEGGSIEVLAQGGVVQTTAISMAEVARTQGQAAALAGMGFDSALLVLYAADAALPDDYAFSPTPVLAPRTAGLVDDYYVIVRSLPEEVRVTVRARDDAGREVTGLASAPVRSYEAANDYILPVEPGHWYLQAYPGFEGHHRWSALTEHAWDITRVDERGSWAAGEPDAWRTGRVGAWSDWHAYGARVLAAADGTVIKVVDDVEFPLERWNRHDGESIEDYRARLDRQQLELFMAPGADPAAVAGGNHVMIEHAGGEISYYAHLAHGSIVVAVGDRVRQGQQIAGLGGTGEAPMVHLHFQVMDRATLEGARTLPVRFENVEANQPYADDFAPDLVFQPGVFVRAE